MTRKIYLKKGIENSVKTDSLGFPASAKMPAGQECPAYRKSERGYMAAIIIDGNAISKEIRDGIRQEIEGLKPKLARAPGLCVILVGDNPASQIYVGRKSKACTEVGIFSEVKKLPKEVSQAELLNLIAGLNEDKNIDGILVQLPLPQHINELVVMEAISPKKDADGLHPVNIGDLVLNRATLTPCTAAGIIELVQRSVEEIKWTHSVIVGRSNIVGKPTALMLLHRHSTITICHSRTKDLKEITKQADILIAAIGKPKFVTKDMVKEGVIAIDVGINRIDGKLFGDIDYEGVREIAKAITPVPGGVGPMTVAMLLKNTLTAYKRNFKV